MSREIKVWVHRVVVFFQPAPEGKKVSSRTYLVPKVHMALNWFREDEPNKKIVRLFSLGVFQAEMDKERYDALHKDT